MQKKQFAIYIPASKIAYVLPRPGVDFKELPKSKEFTVQAIAIDPKTASAFYKEIDAVFAKALNPDKAETATDTKRRGAFHLESPQLSRETKETRRSQEKIRTRTEAQKEHADVSRSLGKKSSDEKIEDKKERAAEKFDEGIDNLKDAHTLLKEELLKKELLKKKLEDQG